MGKMMEIDQAMRIRVLEHRLAQLEAANEQLTVDYLRQVDRANRLVADRQRAYAANMELLANMEAMQGYPYRLQLEAR